MINFEGKTFLITGVANKKSIATFCAQTIMSQGGEVILTVQNQEIANKVEKLFPNERLFLLDVTRQEQFQQLGQFLEQKNIELDGVVHSMAFAPYNENQPSFEETPWKDFALATQVSLHSFLALAESTKRALRPESSIVTLSISNTRATSYGYMGPIKAALDSSVAFLAKSLEQKKIRVNAVCSGPLKTAASAGIPNYIPNYLYAEQLTLRKSALKTQEVANTVCFLLDSISSGINAQQLIVDAGMSANYFDQDIVSRVTND